ncbi:MAG TPA: IS66 family transposase [Gemmataceae bacterium]|nr:IS66 family transposase [Gemmataceae bacterium]
MPDKNAKTDPPIQDQNARLAQQVLQLKAENQWLKEQLGLAKHRLFAPKTEQSSPAQVALLFNEAEACATPEASEPETETITYTRRKHAGQRQLNLEGLPVEEIVYDLPAEERVCPQCAGALHEMGEDVRNEIKIVPATMRLVRHLRKKYACRHCQNHAIKTPIKTASMPTPAFPNSLASPTAVAHIMCEKFVNATPLYRQEQGFARLGFSLSRQSMANWMLVGADWLTTLYARLHTHLLRRDIAHGDETTLQVLKEAGRAAQTDSYLWLYRSGRDGPPIVLFEYQSTRAAQHPRAFLKEFTGFLHVDGYVGYEGLPGITLVGCWAHARRKFAEAIAVLPASARQQGKTSAHHGLAFCNQLFAIERDLHDRSPEECVAARNVRSRPVLEKMEIWLSAMADNALPKSKLGEAVSYCRNQWPKLLGFLQDGRLELDNNRAERAIKPFVIGRKNWLFANTPRGARSSATIYSIVETAKENGLNPFVYLTYLFEQLPNIDRKDPEAVDRLLPWSEDVQSRCAVPSKSARPA